VPDPIPFLLASQHLDQYLLLAPFPIFVSPSTSPSLSPNAEPSCAPTSLPTTAFTAAQDLSPVPHLRVSPTSSKCAAPSAEPSGVPMETSRRRWSVLELLSVGLELLSVGLEVVICWSWSLWKRVVAVGRYWSCCRLVLSCCLLVLKLSSVGHGAVAHGRSWSCCRLSVFDPVAGSVVLTTC
jgi:hypothetical protein